MGGREGDRTVEGDHKGEDEETGNGDWMGVGG